MKDIFDENGPIYDFTHFTNIIRKKHNILCEYLIVKRVFRCINKYLTVIRPNLLT